MSEDGDVRQTVYETSDILVRRLIVGQAEEQYTISTRRRAATKDRVILTKKEALRVAMAILKHEAKLSGEAYLLGLAERLGFKLPGTR